jgi:hypothetical protein
MQSPHADYAKIPLCCEALSEGLLYRIYSMKFLHENALFFGKTKGNRFDDPAQTIGVCYLALTFEGALVETLLHGQQDSYIPLDPPSDTLFQIPYSELDARALAISRINEPLKLVKLYGDGLLQNVVDSSISSYVDPSSIDSCAYAMTQEWAGAFINHPDKPDGIIYRCKHNDDEKSVALFERATHKISLPINERDSLDSYEKTWEIFEKFKVGVVIT